MTSPIQSIWLTTKEAADYLRIAPKTLYNLRHNGTSLGSRSGKKGKLLFSTVELDAYIKGHSPKLFKKKAA